MDANMATASLAQVWTPQPPMERQLEQVPHWVTGRGIQNEWMTTAADELLWNSLENDFVKQDCLSEGGAHFPCFFGVDF